MNIIIFSSLLSVMLLTGVLHAQATSIDKIYEEALEVVKNGKGPQGESASRYFMGLKEQLKDAKVSNKDYRKAGILYHRAQMGAQAIEVLEAWRAAFPEKEEAEVIAILIYDHMLERNYDEVLKLYDHFMSKYANNKATFTLDQTRLIDKVNSAILLTYNATADYKQAIRHLDYVVALRNSDKPAYYNMNYTILNMACEAYSALEKYDEGVAFITTEQQQMTPGSTMYQWAEMFKAFIEYNMQVKWNGYEKANAYLLEKRQVFTDKYVLRKYDAHINYSQFLGKPLPEVVATDWLNTAGQGYDFDNLKGKVVLLDFWATWCHACREAFPFVNELYEKYHEQGFEVVGIAAPYGYVATFNSGVVRGLEYDRELALTRELVDSYKLSFTQIMDKEKVNFNHFKVSFLPTLVIADRDGMVREVGFLSEGKLEAWIQKLLPEN